ncbi:MAG: hypothetical protein ILO53_00425 [Clostridia bacterium]|nr:hypothetical protein [Clostridia bacterium]
MKKTFWVIYDNEQYARNEWFAGQLVTILKRSFDARLIIVEKLTCGILGGEHAFFYEGQRICAPDAVVMRSIYPFLSELLESLGVRVFNPAGFSRIANDKRLSYVAAAAAGLKTADTLYLERRFSANACTGAAIAAHLGAPYVLKTSAGHGGSGVWLAGGGTERRASECADGAGEVRAAPKVTNGADCIPAPPEFPECADGGLAAQRFIEGAEGDVRVYVLGGKIVAAALRTSTGFKSNISLGGNAAPYGLSDSERAAVERLYGSLSVKPDFAGFDFIPAGGEFIFNEMEDVVGTRMLYSVYGIDAAGIFCGYMTSIMTDAACI